MNYYTEHPRRNMSFGFSELTSHGDRIENLQTTACQKQVNEALGAYIVAVQMRGKIEK